MVQRVREIWGTKGYGKYRDRTNALSTPQAPARGPAIHPPYYRPDINPHHFPHRIPNHRSTKQGPTLPKPQIKQGEILAQRVKPVTKVNYRTTNMQQRFLLVFSTC